MKQMLMALVLSLCAGRVQAEGKFAVEHGWVRWVPPVSPNSAAYFKVHNETGQTVDLVSVESDVANHVELHTVIKEGDLMTMKPVEKVSLPSAVCTTFQPGGFHVMLIGLKQPLQEDQQVPLTFHFSDGKTLQVSLPVQKEAPGMEEEHHHHHH